MSMKQRILVLGANGFIGKQVVNALRASDWATPVAAGRRAQKVAASEAQAYVRLDATDPDQLRRAMDGVAGVVNCVAGDGGTMVEGARALFRVAAEMPLRPRIVHLSSMAVYGELEGDVDEGAAPGAGLSAYGAAKLEAERLAHASGLVVVLRLGIVYGPDSAQWSGRIARLLRSHRLGDLGTGGDGYCNLVYVADAVQSILSALQAAELAGQVFNIGLPDCPTWNEYFSRFAIALGTVPVARLPARRMRIESKILAPPLKVAEIIAGKISQPLLRLVPPPIPPSLVRLFRQEIKMKVHAAEKSLGIQWTALEDGLSSAAKWYRQ
jgi:nucleoside-diphosphate-sugar epimerase